MGSFINIVLKLYMYLDSDVGNIQKIKYFHNFFDARVRRDIQFN